MSGIFGLLHRDGRPMAPERLAPMREAMAYWGPDGSRVVCEGEAGLGQLLLHNTPESLHERLPAQTADGLLFTAGARLDNRDALCDALEIPTGERAALPDGALILRAYRQWDTACVDRLLGDWAFAVWDPRRRRLLLARDQHGNTALYSYATPRLFAFASCLTGLLALPEVPRRPDRLRIVQVLTSWPGDGVATCYADLKRLPPAHTLIVTPETTAMHRYWRLEDTPERRLGSDDDYLEAFLEHYTEAVRSRLRSHRAIGTTLSGGIDSSSVTALAARELARDGRRLPAFSSVPLYDVDGLTPPSRFGDETPFIEATRQWVGTLDVTYIRAEAVSPLAGIDRALALHDGPSGAGNQFWALALLGAARDRDLGTLLTGQVGNATVSWTGQAPGLLHANLHGEWHTLRTALRTRARVHGVWATIRSQVVGPLLPGVRRWYQRRRAGRDPWRRYSAVNPQLARALDLTRLMIEHGHDPTFTAPDDPREARCRLLHPGRSIIGALWHEIGAGFGMEVRDPTADTRLMAFCLSVPNRHYARHGGDRLLLRQGLDGLLPREVLWNRRRGRLAADVGRRVLAQAAGLEVALARLERSALAREYLDLPKMRGVFERLQTTVDQTVTREVGMILLRGLMVGRFLERFDAGDTAHDHP